MPRITSIASSSAVMLSALVRRGPPIAVTASRNPPAPMPRLTRPPESRSRLAADRASTAGCRSGRLRTLLASPIRSVRAATQVMSVQVSWNVGWYGWSWKVTRSSPCSSLILARSTGCHGTALVGVTKDPKRSGWP